MCSAPWTPTRLVRWRVKDWASCFLACRFPFDDEPDDRCCPATPQLPIRNMAFDMQGDSRGNERTRKNMSRHKKCNRARGLSYSPKQVKETSPVDQIKRCNDDSNCSRPHSADEEFIVFCFKEDGEFDVVKHGKLEASNTADCESRSSPRPVGRKLNYGENTKAVERYSTEEGLTEKVKDIYTTNEEKCINFDQKDEEEENVYLGTEPLPSNVVEDHQTLSVESSDSNQSDVSTGSFAFPVLGNLEWMGSPVQMPKSESLGLRKHKVRCTRFQCCIF